MTPYEALTRLRDATSAYLARQMEDPATALLLSRLEERHAGKNMYGDEGSHTVTIGIGTVLERARTLARPKRKKRKRKRRDEDR